MEVPDLDTLKTLFSERSPYEEQNRLGGSVIVFDPLYLKHLYEAFTTGSVLNMSEESYELTNDYIAYCDGLKEETPVLKALDIALAEY